MQRSFIPFLLILALFQACSSVTEEEKDLYCGFESRANLEDLPVYCSEAANIQEEVGEMEFKTVPLDSLNSVYDQAYYLVVSSDEIDPFQQSSVLPYGEVSFDYLFETEKHSVYKVKRMKQLYADDHFHIRSLLKSDFQGEQPSWSVYSKEWVKDDGGNSFLHVKPENTYPFTIQFPLKEHNVQRGDILLFSGIINPPWGDAPSIRIVYNIETKNGLTLEYQLDTVKFLSATRSAGWTEFDMQGKIPDFVTSEDIVKLYLWNTGKGEFYLDQVVLNVVFPVDTKPQFAKSLKSQLRINFDQFDSDEWEHSANISTVNGIDKKGKHLNIANYEPIGLRVAKQTGELEIEGNEQVHLDLDCSNQNGKTLLSNFAIEKKDGAVVYNQVDSLTCATSWGHQHVNFTLPEAIDSEARLLYFLSNPDGDVFGIDNVDLKFFGDQPQPCCQE